jgi:tRNA pseudouridine55 synthase
MNPIPLDSVLIVDKPKGPTSFDIVREVKRLIPGVKVGHAGSLDPFATGVLILLVGRATKHSDSLLNADKSYRALLKLGQATDAMDATGQVIEEKPVPELTEERVAECVKSFEGEWMQTPPMFSAKKIKGVRLYELARQNIKIRLEPQPVQLHKMDLIAWETPTIEFDVSCSKGTYVRALADEISRRLGTVGHLVELRRTLCGQFDLKEAVTLEALKADPEPHFEAGRRNFTRLLRGGKSLFSPGLPWRGTSDTEGGARISSP